MQTATEQSDTLSEGIPKASRVFKYLTCFKHETVQTAAAS